MIRNIWLVMRREYLERVRTRAFVLATILVPVFIFAVTVGPQKLAMMKAKGSRRVVVATANAQFGESLARQLQATAERKLNVTMDANTSPEEHDVLRGRVSSGDIDGFLWATDEDLAARKVTYTGRDVGDLVENAAMQRAVTLAAVRQRLAQRGIEGSDADSVLKSVSVDTIRMQGGKENKVSGTAAFMFAMGMVIFLYSTLLMYGALVMQSVLDEKTSRVIEVLLSSVSSDELMIGKILGVGAAGFTQVAIWAAAGLIMTGPALFAVRDLGVNIQPAALIAFPVFFLFGYLLYSASFAAVGAAVNSLQEAQQFNFVVMSPVIFSIVMMMYVMRQPNAPLSVALSLFPFTSPVLMYLRIGVQQPPAWQIAASLALLAVAIVAMMWICARVYRVGVLMYGKRPTLPEIMKWLRYA